MERRPFRMTPHLTRPERAFIDAWVGWGGKRRDGLRVALECMRDRVIYERAYADGRLYRGLGGNFFLVQDWRRGLINGKGWYVRETK